MGPNYQPPRLPTPDGFSGAAGLATTNAPLEFEWWRAFNDPTLNRLIAEASTNNLDLRRAEARLREARALWVEARFDYVPTVRNENSYQKSQLSEAVAGGRARQSELYRAGFDASWELDLWGRVRRSVEAARATVEAVEADLGDVLVSIRAEVALTFFELRGAQSELEVAHRNATNQSETLKLAIALRDGGQGTQLDVARARSLLNATLASIPPLETDVERAVHRLSVLSGLLPTALREPLLTAGAPPITVPTELASINPGDLLRERPDVRAAERVLAAETARIGIEVADLFPRVTFVGTVALEANSFPGLTASGSKTYAFGPRISWAAFDLGRVRQRIKAADARAHAAVALYEQTALLALEETENALVALSRERQRYAYLTEAERAAAEAVSLARQRYRDGIADYLSVLDAERTLLDLQEQLVSTQTLTATRLVAVYKAFAFGRPVTAAARK